MPDLTHFNKAGEAHMVDVGNKPATRRVAIAEGHIKMLPATLERIAAGSHAKGDVLGIARTAGIMAAKRTADLIPLCHPLPLTRVAIEFQLCDTAVDGLCAVHCRATTETVANTGVEMEALTSVQVALLTIYDMCKAVDRGMCLGNIRLVYKSGGKSGTWERPGNTETG